MDPLCDPLTTRPIQTGWEFTMEPYPSGQFGFINDPDRQFGNGSVWTRTRTRSDGPEPLLTLTILGLPHRFGKLLQGAFGLLHADWGCTICTAQVQRIVALIICIILVVGNLRQWGQVRNPCDICFLWYRGRQESYHWEAIGRSPRCAGRRSRWRSRAGRCWPIDWIVSWRSWRHSQCTWR